MDSDSEMDCDAIGSPKIGYDPSAGALTTGGNSTYSQRAYGNA